MKPSPPNIRSTSSLPSPAAFTAQRQSTGPRVVASSNVGPPAGVPGVPDTPVTRAPSRSQTPARTASVANASGTVHGSMTDSSGMSRPASAPGPSAGSLA